MTLVFPKRLVRPAALPALAGAALLIAPAVGFAQQGQPYTYSGTNQGGGANATTSTNARAYGGQNGQRAKAAGQGTTGVSGRFSNGPVVYNNGPGLQNAQGNEIGAAIPGVYSNRAGVTGPQAYGTGPQGLSGAQAYGGAGAGSSGARAYQNGPYTYTRPAAGTSGQVNPALGSGTAAGRTSAGYQVGPRNARTATGPTAYNGQNYYTNGPAPGAATGSARSFSAPGAGYRAYPPQAASNQSATPYGPIYNSKPNSPTVNANTPYAPLTDYGGYYGVRGSGAANGQTTAGQQTMATRPTGNGAQQTYLYGSNAQ